MEKAGVTMGWKIRLLGLCFVLLGLGAVLFFQSKVCSEETVELKISHFGPPNWIPQINAMEPWAKKIEKLSDWRVRFTFFPNQALGKPSEQYDLVIKGIADISSGITEYTPGRFPLTSVMKLPFLGESGEKASVVLWNLYKKYLLNEYKDVKVLWLFCHGPGQLHTVNKEVRNLEDLKGLRIRVGDPVLAKALEMLGAVPVMGTVNEGYALIKEGKADGTVIPWNGCYDFKYYELCRYHTIINMYTLPFFVVMNKEKYEALPADIKKMIDETSGEEMAVMTGRALDDEDSRVRKMAQDRGDFIYTLPKQELERWKKLTMPVGDSWVEEMKKKGLPGQEVLVYILDLFMQIQK
jgi:TRAP-type C4-dicarboxylate transport system substrate-binding protein